MGKPAEHIRLFIDRITGNNRSAAVCIALLCVMVYANSLDAPFYFDDYAYIVDNPFIRTLGGIFDKELMARTPLYEDIKNCVISRPLSYATFALNFALHQKAVAGYHLVNIAIHLMNSWLVHALILLTFTLYAAETSRTEELTGFNATVRRIAFFSAALFAVHPVMTNAVTYIYQRMAALAALFCLLTVVLHVRSRLSSGKIARWTCYLSAIASCFAAVKSKEIAFTLPLLLLGYEWLFFSGSTGKRIQRVAPFFVCVVAAVIFGGDGLGTGTFSLANGEQPSILQVVSFAKAAPAKYLTTQFITNPNSTSISSMSPLEYLITQIRVVVTYQRMLLAPIGLNFIHDYPFYRSFSELPVVLSLGLHVLILALTIMLYRRSDISSGGRMFMTRLVVFGVCWFYLSLVMECGIIPMDDLLLENRMYLPAFGFLLAVVSLTHIAAQRFTAIMLHAGLLTLVIIVFSGLTILRNQQWRDPLVFWQDALAKSPGKRRIHGYIGNVYRERGNMPMALREYRLMLANDFRYGQDHYGLGNELLANGLYREAVEEYGVALKIRPDKTFVYERLAEAYRLLGDERRAGEARAKGGGSNTPVENGQEVW